MLKALAEITAGKATCCMWTESSIHRFK